MDIINLTHNDTVNGPASAPRSAALVAVQVGTLALIGVLGTAGNALVLASIAIFRQLRTPSNVFVGNLALADGVLAVALIVMTLNVAADRNALGTEGCVVWGSTAGASIITSTFTLAAIALNRCILVVHGRVYKKIFTGRKSLGACALIWWVAVWVMVSAVLGWSRIAYNPKTKACSYERNASSSFHYFVICFSFCTPLITVLASYSRLYWTVYQSKRRINASVEPGPADTTAGLDTRSNIATLTPEQQRKTTNRTTQKDLKLTKTLFIIFVVYVGCWGPYSLANLIDGDGTTFPEVVHTLVTWLAFSNCCLNPILYAFMNKNFRAGYVAIIRGRCRREPGEGRGGMGQDLNETSFQLTANGK